jgi:hypothetical protein
MRQPWECDVISKTHRPSLVSIAFIRRSHPRLIGQPIIERLVFAVAAIALVLVSAHSVRAPTRTSFSKLR